MSKILGIIAEYNPFHNGHKYQIEKAKIISNADYVICLISSNFVQRGEASIYSSYERAKMALKNGADVVFEMPAYFSTSSAESFAHYGVDFFTKLGIDYLSFGVESANLDELNKISKILLLEDISFKNNLESNLKKGLSYPSARQEAIKNSLINENINIDNLFSPNNILGIEYIKAMNKLNSKLKPILITRTSDNYNSSSLDTNNFSSATAIRKQIFQNSFSNLSTAMPENILSYINELNPIFKEDIFSSLLVLIKRLQYERFDFSTILDVSPDLANKLSILDTRLGSYEDLIQSIKSKQYTYTRISRILAHILLNINKDKFNTYKNSNISYARLLGFKKESKEVLNSLKKNSELNFITKTKDYKSKLNGENLDLYMHNLFCEELYESIYFSKYKKHLKKEIIIE